MLVDPVHVVQVRGDRHRRVVVRRGADGRATGATDHPPDEPAGRGATSGPGPTSATAFLAVRRAGWHRSRQPTKARAVRARTGPERPHASHPGASVGLVPELPEVEALVKDLSKRLDGRAVVRVDIAAFSCLKTYDPPITALAGGMVDGVSRHGKFLDLDVGGTHLVLHLALAGWVRWKDEVPPTPPRPSNKSPLAARVVLDNGSGLDITEAGTRKGLALYVVRDPLDVPGDRPPRPRPAGRRVHHRGAPADPGGRRPRPDQGRAAAAEHHRRHRQRLLRRAAARGQDVAVQAGQQPDRRRAADARTTPSAPCWPTRWPAPTAWPRASSRARRRATWRCTAAPAQTCPVCGDTVREVSFADRSLQYCATCQTGGKPLADRRMSKLLK